MGDNIIDQELGGAVLGLVGQDADIQIPGEVINRHEQVFPGLSRGLAFEQGQTLGVEMDQFARIGLVVSPGFAFQPVLDRLFDLGQPFQAKLDGLETLVGAVAGGKLLQPGAFEDVVDRGAADPEMSRQLGDFPTAGLVKPPYLLTVQRR